nr:heme-binding protein [Streptomyces cacaoi]
MTEVIVELGDSGVGEPEQLAAPGGEPQLDEGPMDRMRFAYQEAAALKLGHGARHRLRRDLAPAGQLGRRDRFVFVEHGQRLLCAFVRMDGAPVQAIQISQDKAYTAAGFGMPTAQWHEFTTQDAPLAAGAPTSIARFVPYGGGLPLMVDGRVVGGIGVSGGHWSADNTVAEAGVTALA